MEESSNSTALKLWVVLSRAYSAVEAHVKADIARHGLTPAEFGVLEALHHRGPMLAGEVQRKILLSSGGVTYVIDRLAGKGLVERRPCPEDRRARYVALTGEGTALIGRIFPLHARCIQRAVAGLEEPRQREAIGLLRALGLGAARIGREPAVG